IYTLIYSLSPFFVSLISFIILVNKDSIRYELDREKFLLLSKRVLEKSNSVFIGTVVSVIKDKTNIIFIGLLIGNQEVVIYDFISKVINVVSGFFSSFTNAQFPRFSKEYNKESFVKYTLLIFMASIIIPFTGALSIYVIKHFNVAYLDIVSAPSFFGVYIILSLLIPMRGLAYQFGLCFLVSHGYNKEYTNSLMLSFIVYIMFSGIFYLFKINNIYILILPLVFSVLVELLHRLYVSCYKVGLDGK
ncbi:hypothetical protein C9J44_21470, partial [Photobacterium sp. GB-27]|uniref:hypothetical protein n=1 Tax=Photobacterium sp. GB-27 TaxID=2022109 RepID=UPI000D41F62C